MTIGACSSQDFSMRCPIRFEALLLIALVAAGAALAATDRFVIGAFSAARPGGALPAGWLPLNASGSAAPTRYTLVDDGGTTVLHAEAKASASALSHPLRVDPAATPWLRWRWKISTLIEQADLRTREGDDFPARLYVMFDYPLERLPFVERSKLRLARALFDPNLPAATLCYVWDGKTARGTIVPSAYTNRVRLIVVESGGTRVNRWVDVERNIADDFRAAFGEDPPAVTAIAVAVDTDNTGAFATSYFGDISFNKQSVMKPLPGAGAGP
jgi:hypothetical protein